MTQADSVHSTPPINTPILPDGFVRQERQRERALKRVAKLRQKASAEIERLIDFMDATDRYAANELEDAIDDGPCDDQEIEPSLGWGEMQARYGQYNEPADIDVELDQCDREPSLGSVDGPERGWPAALGARHRRRP
jgi:hypothetical protein